MIHFFFARSPSLFKMRKYAESEPIYRKPVFLSFDCEMLGPNPIQHSMVSLGAAIFEDNNTVPLATFYCTMKPQANTCPDSRTMSEFWDKHPIQLQEVKTNNLEIADAMKRFSDFLKPFADHKIVPVASAAGCDWMWLRTYMGVYGPPDNPDIGFYCHCLSSELRMYMHLSGIVDEADFKRSLAEHKVYDHNALNDAVYQGVQYINLRELVKLTKKKKVFPGK